MHNEFEEQIDEFWSQMLKEVSSEKINIQKGIIDSDIIIKDNDAEKFETYIFANFDICNFTKYKREHSDWVVLLQNFLYTVSNPTSDWSVSRFWKFNGDSLTFRKKVKSVDEICRFLQQTQGHLGSGKTTLELSFLESGFQFFSDDIAFLDQNNTIFNSGEHIVACSKSTMDIIKGTFHVDNFQDPSEHMTGKHMFDVPNALICQYKAVNPSVIIFPTLSEYGRESFERISVKSTWLELIQLSISKQFNSLQKQLYMKRLKALSESAIGFRYNRTNKNENMLKEICSEVRDLLNTGGIRG